MCRTSANRSRKFTKLNASGCLIVEKLHQSVALITFRGIDAAVSEGRGAPPFHRGERQRDHATHGTRHGAPDLVEDPLWWRSAVIYQVYVRSFADSDGDGTGDLRGVRSRLGYLKELGVDALWFNPGTVAPRRRRLRRLGLPRHPPDLRHPRGRRAAHQRGPRARHPHDHRHRPEPHLERAPVVPAGPRGRAGSPSASASGSTRAGARTATRCPRAGSRTSRATRGRAP